MSIVRKGDLVITKHGRSYVATSDAYVKLLPGTGEFVNDWRTQARVDVLDPSTGRTSFLRVEDVILDFGAKS